MIKEPTDKHYRSVLKALSWRFLGTTFTFCMAWVITGELLFAAEIGLADTVFKLAAYYLHERFWENVQLGRSAGPDYEI